MESRIHDLLFEVGTTPVMQATSPPEQTRSTSQPEHLRQGDGASSLELGGGSQQQEQQRQPEQQRPTHHAGTGRTREAVTALGGRVGEEWGNRPATGAGDSGI